MKIKYPLIVALATLFTLPVASQIRIGESTPAEKGAVLDLSSTTYIGGLKLPNVNITDLGKIPAGFTEATVQNQDVNTNLTGILVYNTYTSTGVGTYVWDGDNWIKFGDPDTSLPGTPGDWVDPNGSGGSGTTTDNYTNTCPGTTVAVTIKDGYTILSVANGSLSGNTVTFSNPGNGWVIVSKDGKTGMVYVTIKSCNLTDCGLNGVPGGLVAGANTYLTHQYATGTNGNEQCWMVSNSREGIPSSTTYGSTTTTVNPSANGYYYTYTQAATACPDGWRVPNTTEWTNLKPIINNNLTAAQSRWWVTSAGLAFAGDANSNGGFWRDQNAFGVWWSSTTASRYFGANTSGIDGEASNDGVYWFSVRCVKDEMSLSGNVTDWVITNGASGNGTSTSNFTNVCPRTDVMIIAKDGYTLSNAVNGTISGNMATFNTIGSGSVTVTKDGKTGTAYVTVQQPCVLSDCGSNGAATVLTVGLNTYLTHQYATAANGSNQCWMVINSKEGTPSSTAYGSTTTAPNPGANGYYYTYTQAATACPDGWRVPVTTEWTNLKTIVNGNLNAAQAKWWVNNQDRAFAGLAAAGGTNWYVSGEIGYWWSSTTASRNFFSTQNGLDGEHNIDNNYWFSVRCVKDEMSLSGNVTNWVTTNGASGNGTSVSKFTNVCPTTNVVITAQAGYTLSNAVNGTISGNIATFSTIGSGSVTVTKDGKTGTAYVTVQPCPLADCGLNGTTTTLTVGSNTYLTHQYATNTNGSYQCWMVSNSKEGNYSARYYENNPSMDNGAYYTWEQATATTNGPCPSNWHLPSRDELENLKNLVNQDKTGVGIWWTNAGSGYYAGGDLWKYWTTGAYWWSASAEYQYYNADINDMRGTYTTGTPGLWFSARCVKN